MKEALHLPIRELVCLGTVSIVLLFLINALFRFSISGKEGMLSQAGEVYRLIQERPVISDNGERLNEVIMTEPPRIRYAGSAVDIGEQVGIRELFEVKLPGSAEYVPAAEESGFTFTVLDICDENGTSWMTDEDASEELMPVSFQRNTGTICFYQSGIYTIRVSAWGENGRMVQGEITIPVETE